MNETGFLLPADGDDVDARGLRDTIDEYIAIQGLARRTRGYRFQVLDTVLVDESPKFLKGFDARSVVSSEIVPPAKTSLPSRTGSRIFSKRSMRWSSLMLPMTRRIALVPTSIAAMVGMCIVLTRLALSAHRTLPCARQRTCREATTNVLEKSRGNTGSPARAPTTDYMPLLPAGMQP